ncbi:MAG: nucleotidyltransferase domain-containing protein [Coriobacteriia bacterium]|nr:nucleotidyltransferase domain-containing protein [Coriobacteriia bacterium]
MSGQRSLDRAVERLRAFFAARDDVDAAWIFGSAARGHAGPLSDVDVAILPAVSVPQDGWWDLRADLMSRLPGVLGASVDVVALPEASVTPGFEIACDGVQAHGDQSRLAAEALLRAVTEYWDFESVRAQARATLAERMQAYLRERGAMGDREEYSAVLAKVRNAEPAEGDGL